MDRIIKDYVCTDCSAVFDRPGNCPNCPSGYRRPVVIDLPAVYDRLFITMDDDNCLVAWVDDIPQPACPHDGPLDTIGIHGVACTCGTKA